MKRKTKKKKIKLNLAIFITILVFGTSIYYGLQVFLHKPLSPSKFRKMIPKGFSSVGIDVSHHQGTIKWEKLFEKSAYDTLVHFVYCKATEGSDFVDKKWIENRAKLGALGIPNGAYHFMNTKSEGLSQAKHFLTHWRVKENDLPPVLDVETEGETNELLIKEMKVFLIEVEKATGFRPIIYTSLNFYETKFQNEFKDYLFWIAAYSRKPNCLVDERVIMWQFSEKGKIPGINEFVDLNVSKIKY